MCVSLCAMLASCEEHEHDFEKKYSYDEDFHWYACKGDDCNKKSDKEDHDFDESIGDDGSQKLTCKVCGYERVSTAPTHDCEFDTSKWTSNDNYHWYACKQEGCFKRMDEGAHDFEVEIEHEKDLIRRIYTCHTCEHSYEEETKIESVIEGESSWESAFDNLEYTNFELTIHMERGSEVRNNYCKVSENVLYYSIEKSKTFYTMKNADGSYTTYFKSGDDREDYAGFTKLNDTSDQYYEGAKREALLIVSFAEHFDKFKFDEASGIYYSEEVIDSVVTNIDASATRQIYCYDTEIKVADGKIVNISSKYYFNDNSDIKYSYKYENIGITEVTVPRRVIDTATPESN